MIRESILELLMQRSKQESHKKAILPIFLWKYSYWRDIEIYTFDFCRISISAFETSCKRTIFTVHRLLRKYKFQPYLFRKIQHTNDKDFPWKVRFYEHILSWSQNEELDLIKSYNRRRWIYKQLVIISHH